MTRQRQPRAETSPPASDDLTGFACPNEDCGDFNRFAVGNLSVCERMGKDHRIRRLYCKSCGHRFSEREGSLMARTKLPEETIVRIVKCLGYGCSMEATADICEVDPRTVELLLAKAGSRADDFHRLQLDRLSQPVPAVEIDELHAPLGQSGKGGKAVLALLATVVGDVAARGFTWPWRPRRGS